jgi:hypothetical protein
VQSQADRHAWHVPLDEVVVAHEPAVVDELAAVDDVPPVPPAPLNW